MQILMQILINLGVIGGLVAAVVGVLYWYDSSDPEPASREDQFPLER